MEEKTIKIVKPLKTLLTGESRTPSMGLGRRGLSMVSTDSAGFAEKIKYRLQKSSGSEWRKFTLSYLTETEAPKEAHRDPQIISNSLALHVLFKIYTDIGGKAEFTAEKTPPALYQRNQYFVYPPAPRQTYQPKEKAAPTAEGRGGRPRLVVNRAAGPVREGDRSLSEAALPAQPRSPGRALSHPADGAVAEELRLLLADTALKQEILKTITGTRRPYLAPDKARSTADGAVEDDAGKVSERQESGTRGRESDGGTPYPQAGRRGLGALHAALQYGSYAAPFGVNAPSERPFAGSISGYSALKRGAYGLSALSVLPYGIPYLGAYGVARGRAYAAASGNAYGVVPGVTPGKAYAAAPGSIYGLMPGITPSTAFGGVPGGAHGVLPGIARGRAYGAYAGKPMFAGLYPGFNARGTAAPTAYRALGSFDALSVEGTPSGVVSGALTLGNLPRGGKHSFLEAVRAYGHMPPLVYIEETPDEGRTYAAAAPVPAAAPRSSADNSIKFFLNRISYLLTNTVGRIYGYRPARQAGLPGPGGVPGLIGSLAGPRGVRNTGGLAGLPGAAANFSGAIPLLPGRPYLPPRTMAGGGAASAARLPGGRGDTADLLAGGDFAGPAASRASYGGQSGGPGSTGGLGNIGGIGNLSSLINAISPGYEGGALGIYAPQAYPRMSLSYSGGEAGSSPASAGTANPPWAGRSAGDARAQTGGYVPAALASALGKSLEKAFSGPLAAGLLSLPVGRKAATAASLRPSVLYRTLTQSTAPGQRAGAARRGPEPSGRMRKAPGMSNVSGISEQDNVYNVSAGGELDRPAYFDYLPGGPGGRATAGLPAGSAQREGGYPEASAWSALNPAALPLLGLARRIAQPVSAAQAAVERMLGRAEHPELYYRTGAEEPVPAGAERRINPRSSAAYLGPAFERVLQRAAIGFFRPGMALLSESLPAGGEEHGAAESGAPAFRRRAQPRRRRMQLRDHARMAVLSGKQEEGEQPSVLDMLAMPQSDMRNVFSPAEIVMLSPPAYMNQYGTGLTPVGRQDWKNVGWNDRQQPFGQGQSAVSRAGRFKTAQQEAEEFFRAQAILRERVGGPFEKRSLGSVSGLPMPRYQPPEMTYKENPSDATGKLLSQQVQKPRSLNTPIRTTREVQMPAGGAISESEINKMVDRIYSKLESRIKAEKRRFGL